MSRRRGARPTREPTDAREALERRWRQRLVPTPQLAELFTGEQNRREPYHRWLAYRQAFAPRLVRLFLAQAERLPGRTPGAAAPGAAPPLLDPFAGSGTFPIECARQDVPAIGVEALPALCFLAGACSAPDAPPLPPDVLDDAGDWRAIADRLTHPLHRAALMIAVARRHDSDGRPLREPPPLPQALRDAFAWIQADRRTALPRPVDVRQGDARTLDGIADESIGGLLTSPPYLSRHDYTRLTRPLQDLYARWHPAADPAPDLALLRGRQLRAHPRAHATPWRRDMPPAVREAVDALREAGEPRLAGVVRSYFEDLFAALAAAARVLQPGRPCWVVIGGARLRDVYVPSDLVLAEHAAAAGFELRQVRAARRLIPTGRKLGRLEDVSPRESLLILRRC